jgi:hypothetical protein
MPAHHPLLELAARILGKIARWSTSDVVALDLSTLERPPDQRGWKLTVVSPDLGPAKVRSLIEDALPRWLCKDFIRTVERGGLLYMLFKDGRMEYYGWVGTKEPHEACFAGGPEDTVSWNSWTIREARGKGLLSIGVNLMGWHAKQQGYKRLLGAVEAGNTSALKGFQRGGFHCAGRYTVWTLFGGLVSFRIEHAAHGLARYRCFFGLQRDQAPTLRHPDSLPEREPTSG